MKILTIPIRADLNASTPEKIYKAERAEHERLEAILGQFGGV
jgi:hypothetical protein